MGSTRDEIFMRYVISDNSLKFQVREMTDPLVIKLFLIYLNSTRRWCFMDTYLFLLFFLFYLFNFVLLYLKLTLT